MPADNFAKTPCTMASVYYSINWQNSACKGPEVNSLRLVFNWTAFSQLLHVEFRQLVRQSWKITRNQCPHLPSHASSDCTPSPPVWSINFRRRLKELVELSHFGPSNLPIYRAREFVHFP